MSADLPDPPGPRHSMPSPFDPPATPASPDAPGEHSSAAASYPPHPMDELSGGRRRLLRRLTSSVALLAVGVFFGLKFAPEAPRELRLQLQAAEHQLAANRVRMAQLEATVHDSVGVTERGRLRPADRSRHEKLGKRYVMALRRAQAQGAADLMSWFIGRWDQLLDFPQEEDRTGRRAAALSLLVGGMAENLNEGDFVPWQAEFLEADWLGELHFDMDGDGLPNKRSGPNTHDGFANVSICHVAMALNQAMTDGRVLMMPNMRCDRPEARMSVFLQGNTFDDALSEFVKSVREQGFLVVEKYERGVRLVLVGARPPVRTE
jgi:hypothetical protein